MKTLKISAKEQKVLSQFKQLIVRSLENNLVSLQLFGSKARGDYNDNSDTDILLIVRKKEPKVEEIVYEIVIDLMLNSGIYLSVKIFDSAEFEKLNRIPTVFMQKVKQEAIKL